MSIVLMNPGSGPVRGKSTMDHAWANMERLVEEARIPGATFERDLRGDDDDGRFDFVVKLGLRSTTVCMPGLPLTEVRFDPETQNSLEFPRLYVDGNSWWWKYAVGILRSHLTGEDE